MKWSKLSVLPLDRHKKIHTEISINNIESDKMIRPLSSPAITYLRPPSKFPRSFVADAVIDNMNKAQPKSQPVNPLSAPLATVCKINPKKIRRMPVPNRAEEAFLNEDFDNLCQSVRLGKGNAVPIMVRRCSLDADGTEFLLLYGERRLRACEVENVDVDAIIAVGKEDAAGEFLLMLRENLCRAALSPVELGRQARYALEKKLVPTLGRFALEIGSCKSRVTGAVQLAQLPEAVLDAFTVQKDLQHRDAKPLTDAVKANLPAVLEEIQKIKAEKEVLSTKAIVSRLVAASGAAVRPSNSSPEIILNCQGERFGQMMFDKSGKVELRFDKALNNQQRFALEKGMVDFFKKKILRIGAKPRVAKAPVPGASPGQEALTGPNEKKAIE